MASAPPSPPPRTFDELLAALQQRRDALTRSQRLLADRVMADPEGVAFMTVSDLAAAVGVNEATVVRFATSLGLDGYPGLTRLCRERLREQAQLLRRYSTLEQLGSDGEGDLMDRAVALDRANITRTFARIAPETFQEAVRALAEAPRVHVLGLRKCHAPAYLLGYLLRMVRDEVVTLTTGAGTLTDDLRRVREGDCFVAVSIYRYTADTVRAAAWARARGARCVALTDNPGSPLAASADHVFYVEASGPSVLRSMTAFTALVQALATDVARVRGRDVRSALLREEELLEEFSVYDGGRGERGERRAQVVERARDPGEGQRVGRGEGPPPLLLGLSVEEAGGHAGAQGLGRVAERLAGEHADTVPFQQLGRQRRAGVDPAGGEAGAQGREVGVEVEAALGRAAQRARGGELGVHGARHRRVQAAGCLDVRQHAGRVAEHVLGDGLHGRGEAGPHLAGHAGEFGAQALAPLPRGQAREADAPAAQRHRLAQPGGDHGPLRQECGGARRPGAVVDQLGVDLVGDDGEAVAFGQFADGAQLRAPGDGAGRVVGDGEDQHAGALGGQHAGQPLRVGNAARPVLRHLDADDPLPREGALRRVADPGRARKHHVAGEGGQQGVEEGLAARREEDLARLGGQFAPGEPPRRGLARPRGADDGPVPVPPGRGGEPVGDLPGNGEPRLAEREVQQPLPPRTPGAQRLVDGQGCRVGHHGRNFYCINGR